MTWRIEVVKPGVAIISSRNFNKPLAPGSMKRRAAVEAGYQSKSNIIAEIIEEA